MKHFILSGCVLACSLCLPWQAEAQTLSVNMGNISFAHQKAAVGEMNFADGKTLTIEGRTYNIGDITNITVDDALTVDDNTVSVAFNDDEAQVTVAGNLAANVDVSVKGANVCVLANANITEPITYTLSGSSSQGSFYMDGSANAAIVLDNLSLSSPDSAAIFIENGKLISLQLVGSSTLADAANNAKSACLYINGHAEISGEGQLSLCGHARHAYFSDEYTLMKGGSISVSSALADGMHVNEYFQMDGGTITITSEGDGIDVGAKKNSTNALNGQLMLNGGTLNVTSTGTASKAIKADGDITLGGADVTATAKGGATYETTVDETTGKTVGDVSSSAAIKTDGALSMTAGTVALLNTGEGGRGLNAAGAVSVSGGKLSIVTMGGRYKYDSNYDSKPQGLKSDGDITLSGGKVYVAVSIAKATTLKTDYNVNINGATVVAIGGKDFTPSASSQAYSKYTAQSFTAAESITVGGTNYDFTLPAGYSISNATVLVSKP